MLVDNDDLSVEDCDILRTKSVMLPRTTLRYQKCLSRPMPYLSKSSCESSHLPPNAD